MMRTSGVKALAVCHDDGCRTPRLSFCRGWFGLCCAEKAGSCLQEGDVLKALSMMQPYAWLFSRGLLTIDDRAWGTRYCGPLAIHASKGFHQAYYDFLKKHTDWDLPPPGDFEHGGIVGLVQMVDCLPGRREGSRPQLHRSHFGMPGYHGFVFEDPVVVEFIRMRGMPGLFSVPKEIQTQLDAKHAFTSV